MSKLRTVFVEVGGLILVSIFLLSTVGVLVVGIWQMYESVQLLKAGEDLKAIWHLLIGLFLLSRRYYSKTKSK